MIKNLQMIDKYNDEITYDINLEILANKYYNKEEIEEKLKRLLIFIERDKKKLRKIYEGDEEMERLLANIEELGNDEIFVPLYDRELHQKNVYECSLEDTYNEGMILGEARGETKGKILGAQEEKFKLAKNLALVGDSIDKIIKVTGLSKKDIEKLT